MTGGLALLFVAAAATSNWMVDNVGRDNGPSAPRTVPIGWGLDAPSGVLLIGVMIAVRDVLHERTGLRGTLLLIGVASAVSAALAPAGIAIASAVTMLTAESSDALVYQRLRGRGRVWAAVGSNFVSSIIDSALFLTVAFGTQAALTGTWPLTFGKFQASLVTLLVVLFVALAAARTVRCPAARGAPD